mmetsp:Transcript_59235/g.171162  ORF Transcript_59235/g.171162 Transcript_59235/m.171162 type:complete len:207 (+) Transcript_59235:102-722(+)
MLCSPTTFERRLGVRARRLRCGLLGLFPDVLRVPVLRSTRGQLRGRRGYDLAAVCVALGGLVRGRGVHDADVRGLVRSPRAARSDDGRHPRERGRSALARIQRVLLTCHRSPCHVWHVRGNLDHGEYVPRRCRAGGGPTQVPHEDDGCPRLRVDHRASRWHLALSAGRHMSHLRGRHVRLHVELLCGRLLCEGVGAASTQRRLRGG